MCMYVRRKEPRPRSAAAAAVCVYLTYVEKNPVRVLLLLLNVCMYVHVRM
jgi:hypothetical protein